MSLHQRLTEDLKAAMLSGDTNRRDTVRLLVSSLRNAEIDNHGPLDEEAETRVVAKEVKQRRDSITEYGKAGRTDLVDREQAELGVLLTYLPEQLTPDEIRALVTESIARTGAKGPGDIGKVMKDAVSAAKGRADGSTINVIAREILMSANG